MFSNLRLLPLLLASALFLTGCGDLLGKKVVKRSIDSTRFAVECELKMDKFSQILNENIGSQIRCLGENLNLFIKIVKSGKPGYLSRAQLEEYLATYRPDVKPEVVKALKSVFALGHLITGEDPDYISQDTVNKVISFAIVFNQQAAPIFGPIFRNESPVTFALHQNHRARVSTANKAIIEALRSVYNPNRRGQIHKLDIIELLESFSTETNRPSIENAKKVLFLKKVLLGGENQIITHLELDQLILNFDRLILIALDAVRYKYIILNQESILQLLQPDVNVLYEIITQGSLNNRDTEKLFTVDEAMEAAKLFIDKDQFDLEKFRGFITEAKKIVMKGDETNVLGAELKNLFNHAKTLIQTGMVFHRIYQKFKVQLDSSKPVEETINFDEYRHTYPQQQAQLDQFERITKKYRFMKGEFLTPYYIRGFKRNPDAIFEIALFEYGLTLVFQTYGAPSPNGNSIGGYSMDKDQMQRLVKKFEKELVALDFLFPGRAAATADNISLLGSLFQYQSDKNKVMDVNEATEFGVSVLGSMNIADDIFTYLKAQKCSQDEPQLSGGVQNFGRYDPACVRKNFWKGLCTYYRSYFPLLFESLNAPKKCEDWKNGPESDVFLGRAISAARTCTKYTDGNKEEVFFAKSDVMTVMLALMHAETTVLRWDKNKNNIMDANEVMDAYSIYSPALDGFLEDKNAIIKKFKKQIFQYMIKYEEIPDEKQFSSIWKFVRFLLSFNKDAPATRKTIVALLDVVSNENKKLQTGPVFNCNLLRDPENMPTDYLPASPVMRVASMAPVQERIKSETGLPVELVEVARFIESFGIPNEQLRVELSALTDDILNANVKNFAQIRQIALGGLMMKIASSPHLMDAVSTFAPEGTQMERIALAISAIVLN